MLSNGEEVLMDERSWGTLRETKTVIVWKGLEQEMNVDGVTDG